MGHIVFYLGILAITFAIIYMMNDQENFKFFKVNQELSNLKISLLYLKSVPDKVGAAEAKVEELKKEVEALQDHCASLRKSQLNIQDKVSKKRPLLGFTGPLQVEILPGDYKPPKNLGGKKK